MEVLSNQELWGHRMADIVAPSSRRRLRVPADELAELGVRRWSHAEVVWRASAMRVLGLAADGEPLVAARAGVRLPPSPDGHAGTRPGDETGAAGDL